ncbi:structural cement protein Gp24 [Allopontixanthobacter sediminis]|uniref:DUF2190 family protein n=1 Tax=Allopontixanthobacter sediminis TaxID=1689985 RepID=A0A845AYG5_9SPHN|nr:hypothetical protein [Allopontixanthobacter sediminis]MXP42976.1 hypothetical protein [Allopontixanthobacter sediminis]
MPALQTTYPLNQAAGFPGMRADMAEWDARTRTATSVLAFGGPVQRAGDEGVTAFVSGGEFMGLAGVTRITNGTGETYAIGDNVPVADEGCYFGVADEAIVGGTALKWNVTTGRWTTATASGTIIAVPNTEAETSASGAGVLFKVRLRRVPS